jgi:uncharacterized protein
MAVFVVIYHYVDDHEALAEHRPAHRAYFSDMVESGELIASGPTRGSISGLLIFTADSSETVEKILDADPFWLEGLISRREILEWTVAVGSLGQAHGD